MAAPTAPSAAAFPTDGDAAAINTGINARSGNIPPDLAMSLMAAAERLSLTPLFDFVLH